MGLLLAASLAHAIVPIANIPVPEGDPCTLLEQSPTVRPGGSVTIDDLVELADIGRSDPNETASPFGISPDGRQIAFLVRRGNAQTNSYCQTLLVMPLDGTGTPREIARDAAFIRDDFALRSFTSVAAGWAKVIVPRWSPDGKTIAWLRLTDGISQVWLSDPAGRTSPRQLTASPDNVDDFAWTPDGQGIVIATRPGIRHAAEAIAAQSRRGYLYDETVSPQFGVRPIPTGPMPKVYARVDIVSGQTADAGQGDVALLVPPPRADAPEGARLFTPGPAENAAWLEPKDPDRFISPSRLVLRSNGEEMRCNGAQCEGILRLWWSETEHAFLAVRKGGWGLSSMAILRWNPDESAPREVLVSDDMLIGCSPVGAELICAREGAVMPRRLVALDLRSGAERLVYDPNPDFAARTTGPVQRFRFRNAYGVESYADLVLPPDHKPGEKHPLVVVQYISHGLLRGGSGDEVPIQPLAARGFAVLSFAKPDLVPQVATARDSIKLLRANRVDWLDRRNVQSSLEIAVGLALRTGAVDRERMGITGWSDGVSSAQFALINSDLFKVAALGSCCEDMYSFVLEAGPAFSDFTRSIGYRFFEPGDEEFWQPMSLIQNVDRVSAPILIQNVDSEYEGGLDVVEVFRLNNRAIELHVFEDETHYKWQPAHRRTVYERNIRWLEFWLMHRKTCKSDAATQAELERWQAMPDAPSAESLVCAPLP
ncbi:Atxe2 family lasso peptide isopeptidase [Porphyrobacter sp. YT40]|uniref:Atxe2 family lasso peptide isopeptidase n=1 Tax=Porphyrobacter sp. YT40 TaxID=2547601 RepID=UPI001142D1AE|nr:Atxe2 family lasso peptide isopeptidase [Porphyrobacter sp. YT40]QDH33831.1 Atxe2 family lasso peptide isopeptidase [Porphyrobacter sp. YT40]